MAVGVKKFFANEIFNPKQRLARLSNHLSAIFLSQYRFERSEVIIKGFAMLRIIAEALAN